MATASNATLKMAGNPESQKDFLEVLKMQAGFFLLEVGCVTKASTTEIMTKVTLSGRLAATCATHFRVTA